MKKINQNFNEIFDNVDYFIFDLDSVVLNKEFKDDDYIEIDNYLNVNNILNKNIFIILEINKSEYYKFENSIKLSKNENIKLRIHFKMSFQNVKQVENLLDHELKIKVYILNDDINNINEWNIENININENQNENFEKKVNIFFIYNCEKLLIDKSELKIKDKNNKEIVIIKNFHDKPIYKTLILKKENKNEQQINFINIKKVKIENFKHNDLDILNICPNVENLKIIQSIYNLFEFPEKKSFKLLQIKLEGLKLITESFLKIISELLFNKSMTENLEILSFRDNKISEINIKERLKTKFIDNNIDEFTPFLAVNFKNLKELDLGKNLISYFIVDDILFFPSIKILYLSDNNFVYPIDYEGLKQRNKNVILIVVGNYFVLKSLVRNEYIKELIKRLKKINYHAIKKLSFNYLFGKKNIELFEEIDLYNFKENLKYLYLGNCSLTNGNIINFFKNKFKTPKLKKLYINGNQLDDNFFSLYIVNELHLILQNLKFLNISNNEDIEFKDIEIFYKFISSTKIKELIIFHTKFEDYILNNIKEIIINLNANKKNDEVINKKIIKNQEFEKLLKFLQEKNVKLHVSLINKKQHSTYKKYLFQYSNFILIK